jgi:hypothetical protein
MNAQPKIDPIRDRYFRVLEGCEKFTDILFFVSAGLALAAVFTDQSYPEVTSVLQRVFVVIVCAMLALDITSRFILSPQGADARLKDFWAKVYNRPLTTETTVGYFNSDEVSISRRAAAQVLENVLFTKTIVAHMLKNFLPLGAASLVVLLFIWVSRGTSLSLIASVTQVVLAEQILVRGVRMFWLKRRCDNLFIDLEQIFLANHRDEIFAALAFEYITKYEASKALANITLSDSIFEKLNPELSDKWDDMKPRLGIS